MEQMLILVLAGEERLDSQWALSQGLESIHQIAQTHQRTQWNSLQGQLYFCLKGHTENSGATLLAGKGKHNGVMD